MNLFYLDEDPVRCAQQHCDKHVVKMITELGQILCTVVQKQYLYDPPEATRIVQEVPLDRNALYRPTHTHHPTVKWCSNSSDNFEYTYKLFCALSDEYTYRYGKIHATSRKLHPTFSQNLRAILAVMERICLPLYLGARRTFKHYFYAPPQVMPEQFQVSKGRGTFFLDKKLMLKYASVATVAAYREYYLKDKMRFAKWTRRETPNWVASNNSEQKTVMELMERRIGVITVIPGFLHYDLPFKTASENKKARSTAKRRFLLAEHKKWRFYEDNRRARIEYARLHATTFHRRGDSVVNPWMTLNFHGIPTTTITPTTTTRTTNTADFRYTTTAYTRPAPVPFSPFIAGPNPPQGGRPDRQGWHHVVLDRTITGTTATPFINPTLNI